MPPPDDDETHGDENSADDDVDTEGSGKFIPPPTVEDAKLAYKDIQEILHPQRNFNFLGVQKIPWSSSAARKYYGRS